MQPQFIALMPDVQRRFATVPEGTTLARVVIFNPNGYGATTLEFKFEDGCWAYSREFSNPELLNLVSTQTPETRNQHEQTKNAVVRLWALAKALKKDPDAVRVRFEKAWGQVGGHMHDKVHYHYNDEVDDWWCSLDLRNRDKFLTHPQLDFV